MEIGVALTDALDFLHKKGLTHRDIKPQNILFVNNQPKLGDLGLITEIRPPEDHRTAVGTFGYMPPLPELPGTAQADIYALGIMLYVLSTGRESTSFPDFATTLIENPDPTHYLALNSIMRHACQPERSRRYSSAREMNSDLKSLREQMDREAQSGA